jgi:hypothetical protein
MHCNVDAVLKEVAVDLPDERPLTAQLRQVAHPLVTTGSHLDQLGGDGGIQCLQGGGDLLSLMQRHRAGPGAESHVRHARTVRTH